MSLQLLTGYSSGEEEPAADRSASSSLDSDASSDDESDRETQQPTRNATRNFSGTDPTKPPPDPSLPSALDAFAEITGPPEFLNNCVGGVEETREALGVLDKKVRDRSRRDKRDLPAGAVVEAKPQLVAIRDRVTVDGGNNTSESVTTISGEGKRKIGAANPGPEDASDLLRMCLQCGVPKTYSHAHGMVCPICGDRPVVEPKEAEKKKGSAIKDKEKSKRMRGQSSHATWKSETEMQLRQQFD
ncbi:hypothetical protein LUZ61_004207 [Rhynchospora tenuis]|uniref:Uncharacterized protein n=1 Tax=Rhynchospora tenuis TaxID=198213 RepID=A0AAD5ZM87_9POAL|nr:hypothetical protein LUZ61_004207 [Rhynchospora tenuis]